MTCTRYNQLGKILIVSILFIVNPVSTYSSEQNAKAGSFFSSFQNDLGVFMLNLGMERAAVSFFRSSAEGGNKHGQNNYGLSYLKGRAELKKDYVLAAEWFRKSANQDCVHAITELAVMHYAGRGVEKDRSLAAQMAQQASDNDFARAQAFLAFLYMHGYGLKKDLAEAFRLNRLSAGQNHPQGQNGLGWQYYKGLGVTRDDGKALKLFLSASDQGYKPAINNAGWILATSEDPKLRDGEKSVEMLQRNVIGKKIVRASAYDSLAAAYAEAGLFDDAISMQKNALDKLNEEMKKKNTRNKDRLERMKDHFSAYQKEKPWRE